MRRTVSVEIALRVDEPARLAFIVAVAGAASAERLELASAGRSIEPVELTDAAGSRIHAFDTKWMASPCRSATRTASSFTGQASASM